MAPKLNFSWPAKSLALTPAEIETNDERCYSLQLIITPNQECTYKRLKQKNVSCIIWPFYLRPAPFLGYYYLILITAQCTLAEEKRCVLIPVYVIEKPVETAANRLSQKFSYDMKLYLHFISINFPVIIYS